jgi:tight adherence protein B
MLKKCSARDIGIWSAQGLAIVVVVSLLFYDNVFAAILLLPYVLLFLKNKAADKMNAERRKLVTQFKDGMVAVSFSLNAGYSIENSFRESVKELIALYGEGAPIVKCFREIVRRIGNNENIEVALHEFAGRTQIEDIMYFSDVFGYAKRSGGDLISIIKNTAATIRDKLEVDAQIQTALSGKKMEASVMSVMPFGIIAYLRISSPEFVEPLYHNVLGAVFMSVCLAAVLIMNAVTKKIIDIEI